MQNSEKLREEMAEVGEAVDTAPPPANPGLIHADIWSADPEPQYELQPT